MQMDSWKGRDCLLSNSEDEEEATHESKSYTNSTTTIDDDDDVIKPWVQTQELGGSTTKVQPIIERVIT